MSLPASFTAWCVNCFPTVKLALVDAKTKVPQGFLYAWGQNLDGQLGVGDTSSRSSPTRVGTATD